MFEVCMSSPKTAYIRLFAKINSNSINTLMSVVDQKRREGVEKFVILISSLGGSVFYGLSAYNFLTGLPVEIITHNFGTVDSIAGVLFCAGSKRYCVPHARFVMHGVTWSYSEPVTLSAFQIEESLKQIRIDTENMARVLAKTTNKSVKEIMETMQKSATLSPEEAKTFGLIHEIKTPLIEQGADLSTIDEPQ